MERYRFPDAEFGHMEASKIPFALYQFLDKRVVTIVLSQGFCDLFGYTDRMQAYDDMDNDMYKDTHPDDSARIADAAYRFATKDEPYDVIYRTRIINGKGYKIIHAQGAHFFTDNGIRLAQVWYTDEGSYTEDMSDANTILNQLLRNALYEESFLKASYYDHLTGLPSMTHFFELSTIKRDSIMGSGGNPALLFMDFSGMKYYNHKYGFAEGDNLLRQFSRVLASHFGNENCSRLGQDHFAVITVDDGLEDVLNELFAECTSLNSGHSLPLHVGIYKHWFDGIVASMACDRAKFACDMLQNEYSSGFTYYDLTMKEAEEKQQYIIANLDRAINERWIKVYYQPIVRTVNGRVCDEEALARWIDPVRGFMSPGDFIPILEDHRLIYKLDLYIVENVLQKINVLRKAGLHIMPQSINLSRSDFDCCDIVEEIRRRVDEAGLDRSMLTIEITESIIGKDFDFMKAQIDRFRALGFAVWMDDFGSGYSSLDFLQETRFDLIKFDMRFMQRFDEGKEGRIILTELLKMATSLGIDTICEGVETEEQVQFLQEAGCSKLQGYFFQKPIPVEKILEKYSKGLQIGFENPDESHYYELVGRLNLHDLSAVAKEKLNELDNFFNTLPMAIIEVNGEKVRFARSNHSYRDFMMRSFNFAINNKLDEFQDKLFTASSVFKTALFKCKDDGSMMFVEEELPNGATVFACIRRVAVNPVSGTFAVAVAVLAVKNNDQGTTYENIAKALAADYFSLYYVDLETDKFFEYASVVGGEELATERVSDDFFNRSRKDALEYIYLDDRDTFIEAFNKENVVRQITEHGTFTITYRLLMSGKPVYVNMKARRMQNDSRHIIIGVSNVDSQMKEKVMLETVRRNEVIFSRVMALSGDYLAMYLVDPVTDEYVEFSADNDYKTFGLAQDGKDFFGISHDYSVSTILPEDQQRFREEFTKENVLRELKNNGRYCIRYRLMIGDEPVRVTLKVTVIRQDCGERLLIGVSRR